MSATKPEDWDKFGRQMYKEMIDLAKDSKCKVHPGTYCMNFRVTEDPDGSAKEFGGPNCCVDTRGGGQCGSCSPE